MPKDISTGGLLKRVTGTAANGESLPLDAIRLDGGTQPRAAISADVVEEYAEAMRDGAAFPPVVVYNDGETYWLADGFHRVHAARAAGLDSIRAEVKSGQLRDAVLYSVGANADHGLRRTNADKRRAVLRLLEDPEWTKWADREIARRAGVSNNFVSEMRRSLSSNDSEEPEPSAEHTYTTKHGTTATMRTGHIREANRRRARPRDPNAEAVFGGGPAPEHDPALRPDPLQTYTPPTQRAAAPRYANDPDAVDAPARDDVPTVGVDGSLYEGRVKVEADNVRRAVICFLDGAPEWREGRVYEVTIREVGR